MATKPAAPKSKGTKTTKANASGGGKAGKNAGAGRKTRGAGG